MTRPRAALEWTEERRFVLGGTAFQCMPDGFDEQAELREGEFFIFKPRMLVERYASLIDELEPQRILELGIFQGGSTLFFAELARPRRVVAIDIESLTKVRTRLESHAADRSLVGVVRTFGEVDQADRGRLAEIVEESFDGGALDLVVDDCSHEYQATRASFNELFPRLRPGGAYVIEDWWPRIGPQHPEGLFPGQIPLTRLLFEIALALPRVPGLITDISVGPQTAVIRRGDAKVDASTFDISASSGPRGQALLAPA